MNKKAEFSENSQGWMFNRFKSAEIGGLAQDRLHSDYLTSMVLTWC